MDILSLTMMVVMTSIIGGLLHLDRTAAFQFLFSRPLVSSTIIGLLLGDIKTGLMIGMVLEFLWLGTQPFGTALPPDDTVVAVVVPAASIITGRLLGAIDVSLIGLTVLVSLPLSEGGKLVDVRARKKNAVFLARARAAAKGGDIQGIQRQNYAGLISFFLHFALFTVVSLICIVIIVRFLYPHLPDTIKVGLTLIFWSLPFFGSGAVIGRQKGMITFGVAYLLTFGLMILYSGGVG